MWSLRRAAQSFKRQGYCIEASRFFCVKPENSGNVTGGRASICCPTQLRSTKFLSVKVFHNTPVLDRIVGSRCLCSLADARTNGEYPDVEDEVLEHETPALVEVVEENDAKEEGGEALASEPGLLDDGFSDNEIGEGGEDSYSDKAYFKLCKAIMESQFHSVTSVLDKWVEEGNDLDHFTIAKIIVILRKRRAYGKALKFSEWLETTKQLTLTERDYASRLDLIVKVKGIQIAEKYVESIPKPFKSELIYRTLLAGCVQCLNMKKAEAVFKKIRELELPITINACDQMIILYKRLDRRKIADMMLLMEVENVKPSLLTYRLLIDSKGESDDIVGMEQLFEIMKADGVLPDTNVLTTLAKHYLSGGFRNKAQTILEEIEEGKLKESLGARRALLPLYASLGNSDEVARIWRECELDPTINECIAAIEAWGKLGKVEKAEAVFEMMLQKWKKLSSRHYSALLKVYVDHKLVTKGKELVTQMGDSGCWVGPLALDALVRLYLGAGDVEKADSILNKAAAAAQQNRMRPLYNTYMAVMEQYAKRGDIHNTEKLFHRMKQSRYITGRLKPFEFLIQAYIKAKAPAYGLRERMKAENVFPNKAFATQLSQADGFKENKVLDLLN